MDLYRSEYKFKIYRNSVEIFSKNFPLFCNKNGVMCEITEIKFPFLGKARITMILVGFETNIQKVDSALRKLLFWVI